MATKVLYLCSFLACVCGLVQGHDFAHLLHQLNDNPPSAKIDLERLLDEKTKHEQITEAKRRIQQIRDLEAHMKGVPKKFEIYGDNPQEQLAKMAKGIQHIADKDNMMVSYKVKVEMTPSKNWKKKIPQKKYRPKKYNVPLKKQYVRLSNFEMLMKKLTDTNNEKDDLSVHTTEVTETEQSITTRIPILKYKPIISRIKTRYSKKASRPVKKYEFALNELEKMKH